MLGHVTKDIGGCRLWSEILEDYIIAVPDIVLKQCELFVASSEVM
jgi:hypothetical protein